MLKSSKQGLSPLSRTLGAVLLLGGLGCTKHKVMQMEIDQISSRMREQEAELQKTQDQFKGLGHLGVLDAAGDAQYAQVKAKLGMHIKERDGLIKEHEQSAARLDALKQRLEAYQSGKYESAK